MATTSFDYGSVSGTKIKVSNSVTDIDFSALVNDYDNGKLSDMSYYYYLSADVSNVKKDQTVTGVFKWHNKTYTYEFTSKYEDTIARHISKDMQMSIDTATLISLLKANGNKLRISITSGTAHFSNPSINLRVKPNPVTAVSDFTINGSVIDKPIYLDITPSNVPAAMCKIYIGDEATSPTWTFYTQGNRITIPAGTITNIDASYNFYVKSMCYLKSSGYVEPFMTAISKKGLTFSISAPKIENLNTVGELWEKPITVNWRSINQEGYEWEAYYNNVNVSSGSGGESSSFSIPANTFKGTLPASVRVRVYRTYAGVKHYSDWQEISLRLKDIEATISNLLIEGEYWEKPIKLSWRSVNQQQFKVEVLKSNQVLKTYTGTTATSYTIPAEQLESGAYTFRVTVAYANRYVNSTERTVTLKDIQASVSNPVLSGSNIDLDLIFSWTSADQQKYEVEIYKDSDRVKNYSGTTATSVAIPHSSLTTGLHKFRVRVAFKDRWSDWKEYTATLTETLPSIGAFEPDGVITERDSETRIWWTSQNQSKWKLIIDESTTYTGTTEKEKILVAGLLQTGKHSMVLTVTYVTAAGVEKHVTKKAEWIVQGKPPIPTITSSSTFNTNRPTIVWDTQDQQGYILDILKDGIIIYTTDWQNGLVTEHKIMDYLSNGTYTARVKIMNQFSLESDSGSKDFTINSNIDTSINLIAEAKGNCVELTWNNTGGMFEKCYIIRNGKVVASTILETYVDYTAWGDCAYTIRGVTSQDVYKDSNVVAVQCNINLGIMATVGALNDVIQVGISRNEFNFNGSIDLSNTQVVLNGRELPVVVFGEHSNNTYNISFVSKELFHFIEMCKRRQIFLYRDKRQKLYLSITNPSYTIDRLGIEYTIQATEVDYNEVITYD